MARGIQVGDKKIRVLAIDDQPIACAGYRSTLVPAVGIDLLEALPSGPGADALARRLKPDVILIDIQNIDSNGIAQIARLMQASPRSHVVVLTALRDIGVIRSFLSAGVRGYLLKFVGIQELVEAIFIVHRGSTIVSEGIRQAVFETKLKPRRSPYDASALSPRERQLIAALADGMSNKELAKAFALSVRTVEAHRYRIMRKLDIRSVAGLVRYAIGVGIAKPI